MSADSLLQSFGYDYCPEYHVWRKPGTDSLPYTDGEAVETRLLSAASGISDKSLNSPEWEQAINDWPSEYHFSSQRANLIRPFPIKANHRVVELGAGCGAITRWLGETGAEVFAIEGSISRARIAAARCQDLDNVYVIVDDILNTPILNADWVTLIGVLEYAQIFTNGTDPISTVLETSKRALNSTGTLLLAIENQLGLKYFAGCSEDHTGVRYFGVEDLYRNNGAVTFGRNELTTRLARSGFNYQHYYYPFPDYKLTEQIISEAAESIAEFDIASFIGFSRSRDYSGPAPKIFTEPLVWATLAKNGLVKDLSNSFLIIASPTPTALESHTPNENILAWSYSTKRVRGKDTETKIIKHDKNILVTKQLIGVSDHHTCIDAPSNHDLVHSIVPTSEYISGTRLDLLILRAASSGDIDTFYKFNLLWFDELLAAKVHSDQSPTSFISDIYCEGCYIDLIPRNIVYTTEGDLSIFDQEWVMNEPIPLAWLLLRGVLSYACYPVNGQWIRSLSVFDIASQIASKRSLILSKDDVSIAQNADKVFLSQVKPPNDKNNNWPLDLIFKPIRDHVLNLHDKQDIPISESMYDAERIAHAKLIGAYEESERNNSSLKLHLQETQDYAREANILRNESDTRANMVEKQNFQLIHNCAQLETELEQLKHEIYNKVSRIESFNIKFDHLFTTQTSIHEDTTLISQKQTALADRIASLQELVTNLNTNILNATTNHNPMSIISMQAMLNRIAPEGTKRALWLLLIREFWRALKSEGLLKSLSRTYNYLIYRLRINKVCFTSNNARHGMPLQLAPPESMHADHPNLEDWIESHEPNSGILEAQAHESQQLNYKPLISAIIPIYKVPRNVLDALIQSLISQSYQFWQACMVWANTSDIEGWQWLVSRCESDERFTVQRLDSNGGISMNSNAALEFVKGEFVILLDHDDTLTPWALYEIAKSLNTDSTLDFIYSDKDSISADGSLRQNALFKPGWSPEMLHSVNYLTHLNVIRTSLLREIGGWRPDTDGAQDWDLFFRITERTSKISHIPSIHYHWRILPTSTATGIHAKPYAALAQLKSQQDHFKRLGLPATVTPTPEGMFHVSWPVKSRSTDIIVYQSGSIADIVNVLNILRAGEQASYNNLYVILHEPVPPELSAFIGVWQERLNFLHHMQVSWRTAIETVLEASSQLADCIFLQDGRANGMSGTLVEELGNWVHWHPEIAWACAIAAHPRGTVYEAGRVVGEAGQSAPLFNGNGLYSFGWFGGALWYRNARACSPYSVAMKRASMLTALRDPEFTQDGSFTNFCLALTRQGQRGLINPFALVYFDAPPERDWPNDGAQYRMDPYFNPAFSQVSPLALES